MKRVENRNREKKKMKRILKNKICIKVIYNIVYFFYDDVTLYKKNYILGLILLNKILSLNFK